MKSNNEENCVIDVAPPSVNDDTQTAILKRLSFVEALVPTESQEESEENRRFHMNPMDDPDFASKS